MRQITPRNKAYSRGKKLGQAIANLATAASLLNPSEIEAKNLIAEAIDLIETSYEVC